MVFEGLPVRLVVDLRSGYRREKGIAMMASSAPVVMGTNMGAPIGLYSEDSDGGTSAPERETRGYAVKNIIATTALALAVSSGLFHATTVAAAESVSNRQEQSAVGAGTAPASYGLSDLDAMTFSCPKAGLNAAAREAAKVHSEGTYQFAYFSIINDGHHAAYEVHFKSNYVGEPDLKYCVSMYCQQGWDPENTEVLVNLIGNERRSAGDAAHAADCGNMQAPAKRAD